jgi:hypothetical protein
MYYIVSLRFESSPSAKIKAQEKIRKISLKNLSLASEDSEGKKKDCSLLIAAVT